MCSFSTWILYLTKAVAIISLPVERLLQMVSEATNSSVKLVILLIFFFKYFKNIIVNNVYFLFLYFNFNFVVVQHVMFIPIYGLNLVYTWFTPVYHEFIPEHAYGSDMRIKTTLWCLTSQCVPQTHSLGIHKYPSLPFRPYFRLRLCYRIIYYPHSYLTEIYYNLVN